VIQLVLFREDDGKTPFVDWFWELPAKAQDRCRERIERLRALGYLLRRPEADYLRDGIYELRVKADRVRYRVLYFFHGRDAAVISHGTTKQQAAVPSREINQAIARRQAFAADPAKHTHRLTEPL
jgi:phage-related protein